MTNYEYEQWDHLLAFLNAFGSAREAEPGRISLDVRESGRKVEIVMTPKEWVEMVSVAWGSVTDAAEDVRRAALSARADQPFLVYSDYRLEPSPTPELRPDPTDERIEALLKKNGGKALGSWVVLDDQGRVVDRLRDFPLDPPH